MWSVYFSNVDGKPSAGILLTVPIPRLTNVTASEDTIEVFSEGSTIGLLNEKNIPCKPEMRQAAPT